MLEQLRERALDALRPGIGAVSGGGPGIGAISASITLGLAPLDVVAGEFRAGSRSSIVPNVIGSRALGRGGERLASARFGRRICGLRPLVRCHEIWHGSKLGQACCPTRPGLALARICRVDRGDDETRRERRPQGRGGYARLNAAARPATGGREVRVATALRGDERSGTILKIDPAEGTDVPCDEGSVGDVMGESTGIERGKARGARVSACRRRSGLPAAQGLYDPANEQDACGVGIVADMKNRKSHTIVQQGLADPGRTSTIAAPSAATRRWATAAASWSRSRTASSRRNAPARHRAAGAGPLRHRPPVHAARRGGPREVEAIVTQAVADEGLVLLGWRDVPVGIRGSRRGRAGDRAASPPDLRRLAEADRGRGRVRAPALSSSARSSRTRSTSGGRRAAGVLSGLPVLAHHRLQGHGARARSSAPITATWRTRASRARSRSCTSASPPTPFRPGGSPTPTGWSRITARSTRCAATSTGWRRVRLRSIPSCSATTSRSSGRSPMRAVGHRLFRQRARIPGAGRLLARPCHDDAGARGLGRQPADG